MGFKKKIDNVIIQLGNLPVESAKVKNNQILWHFSPEKMLPQSYPLTLKITFADKIQQTLKSTINIFPARTPWKNLQISTWNETRKNFAKNGVTIGGLFNYSNAQIDQNTEYGLYSEYNWVFMGSGRSDKMEDWALDPKGKKSFVSIRSAYVRNSVIQEGKRMAELLRYNPSLKMLILNTERHAGSTALDYSDNSIEYIKKKFGLDLNVWKESGFINWYLYQPLGWLSILKFPQYKPINGMIDDNAPLYKTLRWWHGKNGGSDVITNDLLATEVNKVRPDVITSKEPILRRPSIRSYEKVNCAAEWFYYPELTAITYGAEKLYAITRKSKGKMVPVTMPQFLFKSGMAAPYNGMPSVDMFVEAVNLICMRPTRLINFWNTANAFEQGKQASLSDVKNEKDIAKLKKMMLWIPGLKTAFRETSQKLWKPFGAFLPLWQNAPRNVAIVESFASHVYGNVRWPNGGFLRQALLNTKVPFDVLLDNDLEKSDLSQYDLIVLPKIYALTESMVANLKKAAKEGTIFVADDTLKIKLPNLTIMSMPNQLENRKLLEKEQELLKKFNYDTNAPMYIEEMEQLMTISHKEDDQTLKNIIAKLPRNLASTTSNNIFFNVLEFGKSGYLAAVNDLRILGPYYGKYGKVREKGVQNQGVFKISSHWKYGYDLLNHREISLESDLKLNFAPSELRIIMLTAKPLGVLKVNTPKNGKKNSNLAIKISMDNADLVPIQLQLIRPNGEISDLSHYSVIKNEHAIWNIPLAFNAPSGKWQIKVKEFATGKTKIINFQLP